VELRWNGSSFLALTSHGGARKIAKKYDGHAPLAAKEPEYIKRGTIKLETHGGDEEKHPRCRVSGQRSLKKACGKYGEKKGMGSRKKSSKPFHAASTKGGSPKKPLFSKASKNYGPQTKTGGQ